jgi:hypothetical protein
MPAPLPSSGLKIYRMLLAAYPAAFRRSYGPLMIQHFTDCYTLAQEQSDDAALLRFWWASLTDLFHSALLERWAELRMTRWWLWPLAACLGLGIGYVDYTATEVQATLMVLLPIAFCFGLAAPRRAWRWALVLGLAIPLVHILGHAFNIRPPYHDMVIASLLALIPSFLAAYSGAALRWLARSSR